MSQQADGHAVTVLDLVHYETALDGTETFYRA